MSLDTVYLGQSFTVEMLFQDNNEEPISPLFPCQYAITDINNNRILSGVAAQDTGNPFRWYADVTIPESAPTSHTKKYRIEWTLRSNQGNFSSTEYFKVLAQDGFDFYETESIFIQGDLIKDNLVLPVLDNPTNFKVSLIDSSGTVIAVDNTSPELSIVDDKKIYGLDIVNSDELASDLKPYIVGWSWTVGGRTRREYHFVYVVSPKTLFYVEQLRNYIDKIRFSHPNPNLRFNDVDLLGYLVQGVQIINGTKPQVTAFNLETIPAQFEWYLTNAAAWVGLSAQYIAEGEQAFDFSGQTVSLNVDRSQVFDSALGRIQDIITTQLVETKTLYAKASARPVLGLSPSPSLNTRFLGLYFYGGSSDPSYLLGNRYDNYNLLLGSF